MSPTRAAVPSTFIVEADEATWRSAGLDGFDVRTPPGPSDTVSQAFLRDLFSDDIDGAELVGNNSRWGNFRTRRTTRWHSGNVVLLGDAVHTAHFSVGSGTKMAMEDAIVLAREIAASTDDVTAAFERYERVRQPEVAVVQNAAGPSLSWWEHFGFYYDHLSPLDFAFHFFSRSIDIERIRRRDPELAGRVESAWHEREGTAPLRTPVSVAGTTLAHRRPTVTEEDGAFVLRDGAGAHLVSGGELVEVEAPMDEHDAPSVRVPGDARALLVHGGTSVSRNVVSERFRLATGRASIILDDDVDAAQAATLILSGRADAVARRSTGADDE